MFCNERIRLNTRHLWHTHPLLNQLPPMFGSFRQSSKWAGCLLHPTTPQPLHCVALLGKVSALGVVAERCCCVVDPTLPHPRHGQPWCIGAGNLLASSFFGGGDPQGLITLYMCRVDAATCPIDRQTITKQNVAYTHPCLSEGICPSQFGNFTGTPSPPHGVEPSMYLDSLAGLMQTSSYWWGRDRTGGCCGVPG